MDEPLLVQDFCHNIFRDLHRPKARVKISRCTISSCYQTQGDCKEGEHHTFSPLSTNLIATCSSVVLSTASWTSPKVPRLRSRTCQMNTIVIALHAPQCLIQMSSFPVKLAQITLRTRTTLIHLSVLRVAIQRFAFHLEMAATIRSALCWS
jgi:hypothetical protein